MEYVPFISLFDQYPSLRSFSTMPIASITQSQRDTILGINDAIGATKYSDRNKQRQFLDIQTHQLVSRGLSRLFLQALTVPPGSSPSFLR